MGHTKESWEQQKEAESGKAMQEMLEGTGCPTVGKIEELKNAGCGEQEKKEVLIGFNRSAKELQKKLMKLGKNKGYSSFSLICAGGKENEKGNFSGGLIGDVGAVIEGLFYMAKQQPHIKELLSLTVSALQEDERQNAPKQETAIARLHDSGEMTPRTFNALSEKGIVTLEQLQEFTKTQILGWGRIGSKSFDELKGLMEKSGLQFKGG